MQASGGDGGGDGGVALRGVWLVAGEGKAGPGSHRSAEAREAVCGALRGWSPRMDESQAWFHGDLRGGEARDPASLFSRSLAAAPSQVIGDS